MRVRQYLSLTSQSMYISSRNFVLLNIKHSILREESEGDVFALRHWEDLTEEESNTSEDFMESSVE